MRPQFNRAVDLGNKVIAYKQAEPCSLTDFLCRKERLESASANFRAHPDSRVTNPSLNHSVNELPFDIENMLLVAGLGAHCVEGVYKDVEKHLLEKLGG